ncbi:phospholipase A2 inhibitor gamma subunit B-like isoform X2 [Hyperolius riggenbachi]|uniref:phospholipase A2 inhibitor gamma subunit B-like isoform X2 n=1 Tax=Hyperolius riggenbachi TaxID=752182 RepID=UPI0035A34C42
MQPLGLLFLLCSLIATGYCISCKSCWHLQGTPCSGSSVDCATGEVCVAAVTNTLLITGPLTEQYTLSCGNPSQCDVNGSLTFYYGSIRTATSCCSANNCVPPTPTVPTKSTVKNGLTCRTCSSDDSSYCYTGETMECTGNEFKCGRMARSLSGSVTKKDAIRGCATKSYCEIIGNQVTSIQGLNVDMKMYCSDGATALHAAFFLSAAVLLLTKLLF